MAIKTKDMYAAIVEIAGEDAVDIVKFLKGKKNVSEFVIADKTKLDIQTTRNILYRLNNHNVAFYTRKKDKKKGWYISYWNFNTNRIKDIVGKLKEEKIEKLQKRLEVEEEYRDNFYICKNLCARLNFEHATDFHFKCPECGSLLNLQENQKTIENIKARIKELESIDTKKKG